MERKMNPEKERNVGRERGTGRRGERERARGARAGRRRGGQTSSGPLNVTSREPFSPRFAVDSPSLDQ
ncbi:hypothetical protein GN956_G6333 [Arapaima gigas]